MNRFVYDCWCKKSNEMVIFENLTNEELRILFAFSLETIRLHICVCVLEIIVTIGGHYVLHLCLNV